MELERQLVRRLVHDSPDFEELLRRLASPANSALRVVRHPSIQEQENEPPNEMR